MAWDLGIGKGILPFFGHIKGILTREFSMNTYHIATGGNDNFIRLWDTTYFKQYVNITKLSFIGCIRSRNVREKLPAHKRVSDLKFQSNQSKFLISASYDGNIKFWNSRDRSLHSFYETQDTKLRNIHYIIAYIRFYYD